MKSKSEIKEKIVGNINILLSASGNPTLLRISISCFITSVLFFAISSLIKLENSKSSYISAASSIIMAGALFTFPFIEKEKLEKFLTSFLSYFAFLIILTIEYYLYLISLMIPEVHTNMFSLFVSTLLLSVLTIYFIVKTLKPVFSVIKSISTKIKNKSNGAKSKTKTFFASFAVVTGFLISILTIVKTIVEIVNNVSPTHPQI